jgi:hypothetical protein
MNITIEDLCHDSRRRSQATLTRFGLLGLAASLPNNRIHTPLAMCCISVRTGHYWYGAGRKSSVISDPTVARRTSVSVIDS